MAKIGTATLEVRLSAKSEAGIKRIVRCAKLAGKIVKAQPNNRDAVTLCRTLKRFLDRDLKIGAGR